MNKTLQTLVFDDDDQDEDGFRVPLGGDVAFRIIQPKREGAATRLMPVLCPFKDGLEINPCRVGCAHFSINPDNNTASLTCGGTMCEFAWGGAASDCGVGGVETRPVYPWER